MVKAKATELKLYLTSWQKNMVADLAGKELTRFVRKRDLSKLIIKWRPGSCLASYKLPPDGIRVGDWLLYLTEEQSKMMMDELGLRKKVTVLNVSAEELESGFIGFG